MKDQAVAAFIKWNVPSFRAPAREGAEEEWFATFHLRAGVKLILHLGAKTKKAKQVELDDPSGLLIKYQVARQGARHDLLR